MQMGALGQFPALELYHSLSLSMSLSLSYLPSIVLLVLPASTF